MRTLVRGAILFGLAAMITAPAKASFIDDYLLAKHICGPAFSLDFLSVNSGLLFGKPPAEWTDGDIALLPGALRRCVQIAQSRGVQATLMGADNYTLDDRTYHIFLDAIAQAKLERETQTKERIAAKRAHEDDLKRAQEEAVRERQAAAERMKQADADRTAAVAKSEQDTEKAKNDIIAAQARRAAALERQKALAMEAEANKANAEAEQAEAIEKRTAAEAAAQREAVRRAKEANALASERYATPNQDAYIAAPITATPSNGALPEHCEVSYEAYRNLHDGVSYAEAARILGCYGKEMSRGTMAGSTTVMYGWEGTTAGGNMSAMFQNNRLIDKGQFGLN